MPVFDFTPYFSIHATGDYTLTRRVPGTLDEDTGLISAPDETEVALTGIIIEPEPSLADDEQRARAGAYSDDRITARIPMSQLEASGGALTATTATRLADRITYEGDVFEVTDALSHKQTGNFSLARLGIVDTRFESTVETATAKHTALVSWVRAALAHISDLKVVWGYQAGLPYQAPPVVVLWFARTPAGDRGVSLSAFNGSADPGAEFETTLSRHWVPTVGVAISSANGAMASSSGADAMARDLLTYLRHPDTLAELNAAGLGLVDETEIDLDPPPLFKNTWQPQALFGVRFNLVTQATRATGYFATAEMARNVNGDPAGTVTLDLEG